MTSVEAILAADFDPACSPFFAAVVERLRQLTAVAGSRRGGVIETGIGRLASEQGLSEDLATALFRELATHEVADEDIGALLIVLRPQVLSAATLAAFARVMRDQAPRVRPRLPPNEPLCDTCGTGSDSFGTFNVSTTIMFILAAAGVRIAKHGNRGITSRCGSADVLAALGVRIDLDPKAVARCIEEVGIGFMFAPLYHPAFKNVQRVRQLLARETPPALRARTVFNVLGPLANPARVSRQMIGVYDEHLVAKFADVLERLGAERALVVFGHCDGSVLGLDEFSLSGSTAVAELCNGKVSFWTLRPEDAGLERVTDPSLFSGGDESTNAAILKRILSGEESGPRMDLALLNAGAGLYMAGKCDTIAAGVERARRLIREGSPLRKLEEFVAKTVELAPATPA